MNDDLIDALALWTWLARLHPKGNQPRLHGLVRKVAASCLLLAARAAADEFAQPGGGVAGVEPPVLVQFVSAEYPPNALRSGHEGIVVLRLDIDREGRVTAAVPLGVPSDFDDAARAAALRFRFSAARRGGLPVASRIDYRYAFTLPAEAARPTPTATPPVALPGVPSPPKAGSPPAASPRVEVVVRGTSAARRRRTSAEAVKVVDTEQAGRQTQDMGDVLARVEGVGVRRGGGLGSPTRFSLNGLTDDQVRFFLDGIPLELAGYSFGIANVPFSPCQGFVRVGDPSAQRR